LGAVACKQERYVEAEELMLRAITLSGSNQYYRNTRGSVRRAQGEFESAAADYRSALRLDPGLNASRRGLGICLRAVGDLSESASQLEWLVRLQPKDADAHFQLGLTLRASGHLDTALGHFRTALTLKPTDQGLRRGLAKTLLLAGNFRDGWPEYLRSLSPARLPAPDARGCPLKGTRVTVYGYEGVGDEIMAAGCIPDLVAQASAVTLYTDERLVPLFARSFPTVCCLGMDKKGAEVLVGTPEPNEAHIITPMLFPYFRPVLDAFPGRRAYLVPDSDVLAKWRQRYDRLGPGLKVGLSWRGGVDPESRSQRSIPLSHWEPVLRVRGIQFISLQYGNNAAEIEAMRKRTGVTVHYWPDTDPLANLDGFAAQMAALDLVISVDNSTVHMAGALGVPVWTLLPFAPNWRWLLEREDSPWYPSMHLLRQEKPGDWDPMLERVRADLHSRADKTSF
jgi:tetratricopeptide (TPR) repeat protein